jgi:PAS domain S-box-containing protein/putative nucleotidyltransferase with HDIG domain
MKKKKKTGHDDSADLRESEERYKALFDRSLDLVYINDFEGRFIDANDTALNRLGYNREEIRGLDFASLLSEDQLPLAFKALQEIRETGFQKDLIELRLRHKNGSNVYVETKGSAILSKGTFVAVQSIARDITERKRAEGMLVKSERRFRELSELLPQIVFETDIKGNLTFSNHYGIKSFGYSLEDFQSGINIFALIAPEDRESIKSRLKEILSGSETAPREFQVMRKDGGKFSILMHANAILEGGVPIGIRGIAFDIAERKRAGEALRESEEKYRTLVENAAEAILVAQDGMLKFVNRMAIEIIGYSEQELSSSPFLEFIHPDDREMVGERYLRRLEGDVSIPRYAFRLINKEGSIKWVEIDAVLVAWEGKPATLNFLSNITERKEAEDKLQHTLNSLRKAVSATTQVLVSAVEARDPYTSGHQTRSADLARAIATEMKLSQDKIEGVRVAGTIHDIGKLSIPAEILSKPAKLTDIEFSLIKEHAKKGYEILKDVESPWRLADIVYQHHERMNGSGYPRNLKGDDILMEARILAVADVVEAMASHRPYRPSLGIAAAMEEIEKNRGILYDIDVADACLRLFRENGYQLPSGGVISYGRIGI